MGKEFKVYLSGEKVWVCRVCRTHLCDHQDRVSKKFHGRTGDAFLFKSVANIMDGKTKEKQLTTGLHVIVDVHCSSCCGRLGWRYMKAYEESQKYKEGMTLLEKALMIKLPNS